MTEVTYDKKSGIGCAGKSPLVHHLPILDIMFHLNVLLNLGFYFLDTLIDIRAPIINGELISPQKGYFPLE